MKLHAPFEISSRLMPAVRIGGATISLQLGRQDPDGRTRYDVWIDLPNGTEVPATDLRSGCQGGDVQEGFASLLSFLGAAAESYQYRQRTGRTGDNEDLFPPAVVEWAAQYSDELSMLAVEIEETPDLITD